MTDIELNSEQAKINKRIIRAYLSELRHTLYGENQKFQGIPIHELLSSTKKDGVFPIKQDLKTARKDLKRLMEVIRYYADKTVMSKYNARAYSGEGSDMIDQRHYHNTVRYDHACSFKNIVLRAMREKNSEQGPGKPSNFFESGEYKEDTYLLLVDNGDRGLGVVPFDIHICDSN